MPRYDDDQCEQCGGIRVAKSTLCADCLASLVHNEAGRHLEMEALIEGLKQNILEKEDLIEELLNDGFKQNQINIRLQRQINELMDDVHGPEPVEK